MSGHGGSDGGGAKGWHKGAWKHSVVRYKCPLCGRITRGNGGSTSHERACYRKHGKEWYTDREQRYLDERTRRYGF